MQPSAFSHEGSGAGAQHGFYHQQGAAGSYSAGAHGHAVPGGAGYSGYNAHPSHGEQSPSMSYVQPSGGHAAHMGMYGAYPSHYQAHGTHASPQQHYSHVSSANFSGQPGAGANPQAMLSGSNGPDYQGGIHPSSYSHMGHSGMYYHDPNNAGAMHGMIHPSHASHGQVPGMVAPAGTVPGSAYAASSGHHASAPPAKGSTKGAKAANASSGTASSGKKGAAASGTTTTKKSASSKSSKANAAAAANASAPAAAAPAATTGKAKSSKAPAAADRHKPYPAGEDKKPEKATKKKEKEPTKPPVLKSHLKPPKQAPSAWQVYFTEELQKIKAEQPGARLNVAHVAKAAGQRYAALPDEKKQEFQRRSQEAKEQWERDMLEWKSTLTPEDIKQENMFRTAQRKAGKSRKGNLKDPNAPKKPLSAYFLFLRAIRADPKMTDDVFHGEQETTKQSVLAAAKWRSLNEQDKQPFLEKAEADKIEYERQRKEYEQSYGLSASDGKDGADGEYGDYEEGEGGVPPSLAAGTASGEEPFSHFGLGDDGDLGFSSAKVEGGFGLEG